MKKVLCVGQSAYDITLPLDHYPIENKKVKVPYKVECGGGSSSNCAYLLAKWGVETSFAGVIGNDHYGNNILDEYLRVGDEYDRTQGKKVQLITRVKSDDSAANTNYQAILIEELVRIVRNNHVKVKNSKEEQDLIK